MAILPSSSSSRTESTASTLVVICLFLMISSFTEGRDFIVGGKPNAWKIPSSESHSLNHWAQKSRFQIGDSLVWEYDGSEDSVLQVSKRDYVTCNTSSPIETYTGGQTKVKLEKSGPNYFISGAQGHCTKGQKLMVVVMSEKHHMAPAPAPVVAQVEAPAPAPASGGGMHLSGGVLGAAALFLVVMM